MAKVAVLFKVYAEAGEEDRVGKEISQDLKPSSMQMEEIAFGIKIIKVLFVHEDTEGSDAYEQKLKNVKGVREVEVMEESLI